MQKVVSVFILLCFFITGQMGGYPIYAQDFRLPAPGVMIHLSPEFNPAILKGIKVHPDDPFKFEFILDKGDSQLGQSQLKDESTKLIKYFLASLTIPEKDLWVNLSPYERDRIVPQSFGLTEMGRDLLAEDYMLKQITASLIYPEDTIGRKFWKRIYEDAAKKFGSTNVSLNTFNKVWIVPEKAVVYENAKAGTAYVVESKLKVMLEMDYLSLEKHSGISSASSAIPVNAGMQNKNDINALGSQVVREVIIPELTREVNEGNNFAQLRQVYNSLILATWYKKKIKDSILAHVYANKRKVVGIGYKDSVITLPMGGGNNDVELIYQRYLKAFKKGVYNYIKEDMDPVIQAFIPRKYFSGGENFDQTSLILNAVMTNTQEIPSQTASLRKIVVNFAMAVKRDNSIDKVDASDTKFPDEFKRYLKELEKRNPDINFVYDLEPDDQGLEPGVQFNNVSDANSTTNVIKQIVRQNQERNREVYCKKSNSFTENRLLLKEIEFLLNFKGKNKAYLSILTQVGINKEGYIWFKYESIPQAHDLRYDNWKGLKIQDWLEIFIKIGEDIQDLHNNNYVHGDIKSKNILQNVFGAVQLIDFEFSRRTTTGSSADEKAIKEDVFSFVQMVQGILFNIQRTQQNLQEPAIRAYLPRINEISEMQLYVFKDEPEAAEVTLSVVLSELKNFEVHGFNQKPANPAMKVPIDVKQKENAITDIGSNVGNMAMKVDGAREQNVKGPGDLYFREKVFSVGPQISRHDVQTLVREVVEYFYPQGVLGSAPEPLNLEGSTFKMHGFLSIVQIVDEAVRDEEPIYISEAIKNSIDAIIHQASIERRDYQGRISLNIQRSSEGYDIIIEDNGKGMTQDDLRYRFLIRGKSNKPELGVAQSGGTGIGTSEFFGTDFLTRHKGSLYLNSKSATNGAWSYVRKFGVPLSASNPEIKEGQRESLGTEIRWHIPNNTAVERDIAQPGKINNSMMSRRDIIGIVGHPMIVRTGPTGGIDLTLAKKVLQAQNGGEAIKFRMDPAQIAKLQNASGLVPVIIDIQPMTNLRAFLGLNTQDSSIVGSG